MNNRKPFLMKVQSLLAKFYTLTLITIVSFSCKDQTKAINKEETGKEISSVAYQCPMDCEKGKTYSENTPCPVCKMDLKQTESKHECSSEGKCKEGKCQKKDCKKNKTKCHEAKTCASHKDCKKEDCKEAHKKDTTCSCTDKKECKCEEGKCKCPKCPVHS